MLPSTTLKREKYITVSTPVFNGTRVTVHDSKGQCLGSYGDLSSGRFYVSPSCSLCEDTFASEFEAYEELISRWECQRSFSAVAA
ncbi:MAG: hypothetical protein AAGA75_14765 [Cyanobacteria bacterium P01_E01_bin.6]